MKNLFYTIILIFTTCFGAMAQSPTENYIKTKTYTAASTGVITENDTLVNVTYFDGLGRAKQTVAVRAGGQGQDIVSPVVYDGFGRQTKDYLPYATATQNGNIHIDPIAELEAFYNVKYPGTTNPYSESILESSPLNRVMKQGAPGTPWAADPLSDTDHTIKFEYGTNITDEVRLYKVTTTANSYGSNLSTYIPVLENPGFYDAGRLYKTTVKDENWQPGDGKLHTSEEFKDQQGRIVLKRTYADTPGEPQAAHDTYYAYDIYGNLSYVIPPKVNTADGMSNEELNELCYQYIYDHRNRLVEKKIPGKGWESIVYNKLDLPVFTQDQNMAANNQWLFTKYDKFSRVVYTGIFSSTDSREVLQTTTNAHTPLYENKTETPILIDGTELYYTNTAFPDTNEGLLTINYYDNYSFDLDGAASEDAYGVSSTTKTMSLSTGSKTRVLGTDQWITSVTYYDKKARPIYSYSKNPYLNTIDKLKSKLDFVGKVLETASVHTKDGAADITTIEKFSYDPVGRLLKHTHQLAGQVEEVLAENVYDALGQLVQKKVGNSPVAPLQTVDYSYNIRGWLTGINDVNNIADDLFSFGISYNDPANGVALYNGNISQAFWRTNNTDSSLKNYTYSYDALNRITGALDNTIDNRYSLESVTYDKNGNILALNRQGHINEIADTFGIMDELNYNYDNGNKLLKVEDTANDSYGFKDDAVAVADNSDDYNYDINGNMISDTNKNITGISYNHLNLPVEIVFNNDQSQKISYIYTANGIKQQKVVNDNAAVTTTDYAGAYIYENSSLKFFNHPEGYIEPDGAGGYDYIYQYKDHLGNIRLSYSDNSTVLTDNSFESTTENWGVVATVLSQENGKLKAEVTGQWAGAQKYVDVAVGDSIYYELLIDKATTSKLALLLIEHDNNYLTLKTTIVNGNADGFLSGTYTVTQGSRLRLKVAKDNGGDLGITTHYYLDDVKMIKKDIAIREESNYYPFGLKHKGYNNIINGTEHQYKYNGKEHEQELGLNSYDFGARSYMPDLGRWKSIDPHADSYFSVTPYSSFANNPISFTDPTGKDILFWRFNSDGDGGGDWEQVGYDQLDEKSQKAISNFAQTKGGKEFLGSFANKGDKIGDVEFSEDGKYANHNFNFGEFSSYGSAEGTTPFPRAHTLEGPAQEGGKGPSYIDFYSNLNTFIENNTDINFAETVGHEVFLHLKQYLDAYVEAFENNGRKGADAVINENKKGNYKGYRDHFSMGNKTKASREYYDYINQLKSVFNPREVQKHVDAERKKNLRAAKAQKKASGDN